jgi:glycosyltransferase involved in cell wall biosynthesis
MINALAAIPDGETSASWFCGRELSRMDRMLERADALVICRAPYTPGVDQLIAKGRARRIPVFFDIDDLVFDPIYARGVMGIMNLDATSERLLDTWFAFCARMGTTLKMCHGALTPSRFLAGQIEVFAPDLQVHVLPNFLNAEQQRFSEQLYRSKENSSFASDGRIHMGYFSGSPSHSRDFALLANALGELLDEDKRLVLRIVGVLDHVQLLSSHRERIEFYPMQDFLNLQRLIGEVEVNLAPLQDSIFTNCKSELKFFEAAIVGTITVASPTYAFRNAIKDGENSFLARSYEWRAKLRQALALVEDRQAYSAMAQKGHQHARERYGWDKPGRLIEETIFERGKHPHPSAVRTQRSS